MYGAKRDGEDAPLISTKKRGEADYLVSGTWLVLLAVGTICLSVLGVVMHSKASKRHELLTLNVPPGAWEKGALPNVGVPALTDEDFLKCNAALPPAGLSGAQADDTLSINCGEAEAEIIATALWAAGYNFDATLPNPYIYPAYLQQALSQLTGTHLKVALQSLHQQAPAGKLGTLVKLFAWGLPVAESDLETALDSNALTALLSCQLLAPCSQLPSMTTSTAMFFPVPNTTILMATDWASRSTIGMSEEVVRIVNPEALALVHNSPPPKGLDVLDLDSGSGIHGMVAAHRGAASVMFFVTSARAGRFARFSSWLNSLAGSLSIVRGGSVDPEKSEVLHDHFALAMAAWSQTHGKAAHEFGLVLAQPPFLPVPNATNGGQNGMKALSEVLLVARNALSENGILAAVADFSTPMLLPSLGCKSFGTRGFTGSLVIAQDRISIQAFVQAHKSLAGVDEQVANLKKNGVSGVASGFLFAKRPSKDLLDSDGCGPVSLQALKDPLALPISGQSTISRPCFMTGCPDEA